MDMSEIQRYFDDRPEAKVFRVHGDVFTDAQLLAAHVAGDPQAFTELVHRHRDRLWNVALRTTRDPDEAADAVA